VGPPHGFPERLRLLGAPVGGTPACRHVYVLDVSGCFLYSYWSFFDFVLTRGFFGMAGRPRSRPLGVDSGPGEGVPVVVRGAPHRLTIHLFYSHPDVRHVYRAVFKDAFYFVHVSIPPGRVRGGPDYHFPKKIESVWPIPARIRGKPYFYFYCGLKRSWVYHTYPGQHGTGHERALPDRRVGDNRNAQGFRR
jgi:hypothetical protein